MTYEQARRCMVICKELGVVVGWEGCEHGSHSFWVSLDPWDHLMSPDDAMVFSDYNVFMNWAEAYELTNTRSPEGA